MEHAQPPKARDGKFYAFGQTDMHIDIAPLVSGGTEPFLYLPGQRTNAEVSTWQAGPIFDFTFLDRTKPASFKYKVLSGSGMSNEATVIIYPEAEKG